MDKLQNFPAQKNSIPWITDESINPDTQQETKSQRAGYLLISDTISSIKRIQIYTKISQNTLDIRQKKRYKYIQQFQQKTKKIINKKKKYYLDTQYSLKNQKQDRNVISNLIHHLIKYLNSTTTLQSTVQHIIHLHHLTITFQSFQLQLDNQCKDLKTYVTIQQIQNLWFSKNPQKQQFCLIMRVLSRIFYHKNGVLSIQFSNKLNAVSKNIHYKGVRNLLQVLMRK